MRMRWALMVAVLITACVCTSPWEARARADLGVASVRVSLTPDRVAADGRTRSTVVATVSPPVPGLTVSFGSSGDASLGTATASTDASGRATDVLTASSTPGTQTITASTPLGSGSATLTQYPPATRRGTRPSGCGAPRFPGGRGPPRSAAISTISTAVPRRSGPSRD
jgi:hypothetical protein